MFREIHSTFCDVRKYLYRSVFTYCSIGFLLLFMVAACGRRERAEHVIRESERLLNLCPDSAVNLLRSIDAPSFDKNLYAEYILLNVQAKDKAEIDIAEDSAVFKTVSHFEAQNNMEKAAFALLYSGRVHEANSRNSKATDCYAEAANRAQTVNNPALKGLIHASLGNVYYIEFQKELAIAEFREAERYSIEAGKTANRIVTLSMIGNSYLILHRNDSAHHYYTRALEAALEANEQALEITIRNNMAVMFTETGNYREAVKMHKTTLGQLSDTADSARVYNNIAKAYNMMGNMDSARFYIYKAEPCAEKIKNKTSTTYASYCAVRSRIEERSGNYAEALVYHRLYVAIADSLFNKAKSNNVVEITAKYNYEKELSEKNRLLAIHRTNMAILFALVAVILLCFLVIAIISIRNKVLQLNLLKAEQTIAQMGEMIKNSVQRNEQPKILSSHYEARTIRFRNALEQYFELVKKVKQLEKELNCIQYKNSSVEKMIQQILHSETTKITFESLWKIANDVLEPLQHKCSELSEKQLAICTLLYFGFDNSEIAIYMGISKDRLYKYNSIIRKYLKLESREEISTKLRTLITL